MNCPRAARRRPALDRPWSGWAIIGVAVALAGAAHAAPAPTNPLTLGEALDYARAHYPAVQAALAQKVAADRDVDVARAAYLPQINLLYQVNRATVNNITGVLLPQGVIPSISGPVLPRSDQSAWNSGAGALVSWRPIDFGYRSAKVQAAMAADAAAARSAELSEQDVLTATNDAFMNLAAAQSLAAAATANEARLHAFADAVHALVNNTLRPGVDAEQADAAESLAQVALIQAKTDVENQRAVLATLVDRPAAGLAIEVAPLEAVPATDLFAESSDVSAHPAAQIAAARVRQQAAELRAIGSQYAPQFDVVGAAYGRGGGKTAAGAYGTGSAGLDPDVGNWAVGVQVTVPLGSFPARRAQEAGQKARVAAAEASYRQTVDDLSERLAQARTNLASAVSIAKITPVALEAARQGEAQQRARFQSGLATVVDVTAAEAALSQAESQDAIARLNVWRALAALAAARGDVTPFRNLLRAE